MASNIDQQFIEYIVKSIVGKPDAVEIKRTIDEKGVLLELTVDEEDLGRVIGKRGATAQSLRTLLRALGTKNDARYNLKIIDVGGPRPPRHDSSHDDSPPRDDDNPKDDTDKPADEAESPKDSSADDAVEDARAEEAVKDEPAEDDKDRSSNLASRTRAELADLDDLDL